ncbi:putative RNA polymerase I [Trypanosoma conorhini]|uniref:RNA uridylyltransferase n=1 Tax=Trypanosoma conorhini TaxID=83891 RepID=A0A3R7NT80_9TRYP|nr:putative RNA polymerase I [Trypanosoma conorhini]RNF07296.1 putative RNA polymerase I [Trypanosoma conorhini]
MRRFLKTQWTREGAKRWIALPWKSSIPPRDDLRWEGIGNCVVQQALASDTGRLAFEECSIARQQLEILVQSAGYDANVFVFGGLVVLGLLEVGGDVDFVGVMDVEPGIGEAGEIVSRLSREMRRLGMKSSALPRARVPVIKADRVSKLLPGTPLHHLSGCGLFQFTRQLNETETETFRTRMQENYAATHVDWNNNHQFATIEFTSTTALISALTQVKRHEGIDIPLRLPVDPRNGPEIYRLPFDFCFSSIGLRNSYLLSNTLSNYEFSRHLLLLIKKWGRSSGVINSIDGLLASYALTVMCAHFLIKVGKLPKVSTLRSTDEPQLLPFFPDYRPLHDGKGSDLAELGFLTAAFFEYYGHIFDYEKSVVCTTNMNLLKKTMRWEKSPGLETGRPPFFEFAIKDPYGLDSIGRNLDREATEYVRDAHAGALRSLLEGRKDPEFAINTITQSPPRPYRKNRTLASRGIASINCSPDQLEAHHMLKKMEFHERRKDMERFGQRTVRRTEQQRVVSNVANDVLGWIRSDDSQ